MSRLASALQPVVHDLVWDSPLTRHLAEDAQAAAYTRGTLVDLRCSTGLMAREFLAHGQDVIGIDRSLAMLRRALRHRRLTTAIHADAAHTGLPDASAHAVLLFNVLNTHPNPAAVLAEAKRIALPGARIVILSPTEAATADHFRQLDRRRGWGHARAVVADVLRRLFFEHHHANETTTQTLDALVHDLVADASVGLISSSTIFDCQQVTILRVGQPSAKAPGSGDFALLSHDGDEGTAAASEDHDRQQLPDEQTVSSRPRR